MKSKWYKSIGWEIKGTRIRTIIRMTIITEYSMILRAISQNPHCIRVLIWTKKTDIAQAVGEWSISQPTMVLHKGNNSPLSSGPNFWYWLSIPDYHTSYFQHFGFLNISWLTFNQYNVRIYYWYTIIQE